MSGMMEEALSLEEEAAAAFLGRQGEWSAVDQNALDARRSSDVAFAAAYRHVEHSWRGLDVHAESPQLLARREEAIAYARQVSGRRWFRRNPYARVPWRAVAAAAGVALALVGAWQLSPLGYHPGRFETQIGERRSLELDDHSRIELDAATALRVRYSNDSRLIELDHGQAQFSVAADPARPFKVRAGDRTIVALGTVFTVEYVNRKLHVAMLEGRVAVVPDRAATITSSSKVELAAGQELKVSAGDHARINPKADVEAATAWRQGRIIFRNERLGDAVERLNRYSRVRLEIDDQVLAGQEISGVFDAGDVPGFVRDIERYLPVRVDTTRSDRIELRMR